jgi:hypothetical protein
MYLCLKKSFQFMKNNIRYTSRYAIIPIDKIMYISHINNAIGPNSNGGYTSITLDNGLELQIAFSEITYEDIIKSIDNIENIKYDYKRY